MEQTHNQPLLTVIVPCYNVEKYVDKCISSIVNQTYSNLEILLIDDGSTDSTGKFCDAWQERDSRIRLIHKQNEGLAYARKTGIENATAENVTFLDSDDWIDLNMYSDLMEVLLTTGSDIVQCDVCEVFEDGRMKHLGSEYETGSLEVVERIEGMLFLLEEKKWRSWMGNKIYKKHLFTGIVFPKGRGMGEDFIAHNLFHKTSQIAFLHHEYYFYLQRSDSITKSRSIQANMKNHCDCSDAHCERYFFVEQHPEYHSALPKLKSYTLTLSIHLLRNIIVYPQYCTVDYFYKKAKQLRSIPLTRNDLLQRSLKIDFYLLKLNPKFYKYLRSLYVMIIKLTNKLNITNRRSCVLLSSLWSTLKKIQWG